MRTSFGWKAKACIVILFVDKRLGGLGDPWTLWGLQWWGVIKCPLPVEKLPADYVPYDVTTHLQAMGALQPMNIFLRQEIDRMQMVLKTVRSSLADFKLAIDGTIVLSESLRNALDCIHDAKIPSTWLKVLKKIRAKIAHRPVRAYTTARSWRY